MTKKKSIDETKYCTKQENHNGNTKTLVELLKDCCCELKYLYNNENTKKGDINNNDTI